MTEPDWKSCTEHELWQYVAWHLEDAGIYSVLVGGAVVAIYTDGLYHSGDLDIIPDDFKRKNLGAVMEKIGFHATKGRYFRHPECDHLVIEFPKGPVELGEEHPVVPDKMEYKGRTLRLLSPTDCVKDRLAAYIHWGARDCFDQAVMVCQKKLESINFKNLSQWCRSEGGASAYTELVSKLNKS